MLNRARHELLLNAARDPDLAELSQDSVGRIITMAQAAIAHLQPDVDDPALLDAQTTAVTTFLAGVLTRLVAGDRTIDDADQLSRLLHTVATAVSLARSAAQ
jgi:tetracycline repressor-like protein